jgi:hypothetical protein
MGGGMYINNKQDTLHLTNVTATSNTAFSGGGIATDFFTTTATVLNATINGNTASQQGNGGGIYMAPSRDPRATVGLTVTNTIVSGNSAGTGPNCNVGDNQTLTSGGHNLTNDATATDCKFTAGGDQLGKDPQLGALADNTGPGVGAGTGGPIMTEALPSTSPAVDTADTSKCPTTDERHVARKSDDTACDIGAYEFVAAAHGQKPVTLPKSGAPPGGQQPYWLPLVLLVLAGALGAAGLGAVRVRRSRLSP